MRKQSAGSKSSQYFSFAEQLASCQCPACFDAFFSQAPIPPQVSLTYLIIASLRSQLSQSSGEKTIRDPTVQVNGPFSLNGQTKAISPGVTLDFDLQF